MSKIYCILVFISTIGFLGCNKISSNSEIEFSFFVAGHTYGKPGINNNGLHPPFENKFKFVNQDEKIELGILTGDIVYNSNIKNWNQVDSVLQYLNADIFFAPGNHDVTDSILYENRYGPRYYAFNKDGNLFVFLDPNIDDWNISGAQFEFLKKELLLLTDTTKNVFVFSHQLIWWDKDNVFRNVKLNSTVGRSEECNYWTSIDPLFQKLSQKVYCFAGDVGAFATGDEFVYHVHNKITYIASGMGGYKRDNFVIVDVAKNKNVSFRLISLQGNDIHALGRIEDYKLVQ